jgi:hypothetical protein
MICQNKICNDKNVFLLQATQVASNVAKRLIPLLDRVLIQKAEAVTKTRGGIVIPEKAQAKVLRGTVVAVGPGSRNQVCESIDIPLSFFFTTMWLKASLHILL